MRISYGVVRYLKSSLPVPRLTYSADVLFGCDGTESFGKVFALEILSRHIRAPEMRVDIEEEFDIMWPSSIAENFLGQLLPLALPRFGVDGVMDFPSPLEACACLGDMEQQSPIMVKEIETHVQDLPDAWRFSESLYRDISRRYSSVAKEFERVNLECSTKPQVEYVIEPEPDAVLRARDGGCQNRNSLLQILVDDAVSNLENAEALHQIAIKTFELQPLDQDSLLEQHSGQSRYRDLKEYTKRLGIQNPVGRVRGSEIEEPDVSELLDFDPADFLLEKLRFREIVVQHKLQSTPSASHVVGGLSLLDENSVSADMCTVSKREAMKCTTEAMFELPEILEDEHLDSILTLKLGTYITTLMKRNPVELEDLESRDNVLEDFEKLVVLPALTLETSRFHFLQVPSFISGQQTRIPEDVFKVLFRAKTLPSSISASDWVYLDWHLSQVGHCNNHGCFQLQGRVMENELRATLRRDMTLGQRMPDRLLLLSLLEDSLPWHNVEVDCGNNKVAYPAAYLHASLSNPMLNFSSFVYTTAKATDNNLVDQSILTHEPSTNFPSARDQVPLAGSGLTPMDSVFSLMKQARQGDVSKDSKPMQASENEIDQPEGYQGIGNTKNQCHDQTSEEYQVFESASIAVKIPPPYPPSSSEIDATSSYNFQFSNHDEQELQVSLCTTACQSGGASQIGIKPVPPLQLASEELSLEHSGADDLIQFTSGQGQEPHLIVVANILQSSGSILLQRRSTYQKILGLENEDLQVAERELKLPVDLIINPSTCLTVYTKDRLLRYAKNRNPNPEEFFSCVMDMIVDCHMKALSFSFQKWFMIFEGDLAFTSTIIPILDKLYICSAAFQMRVQAFISASPITTDSLVLRCIKKMWKTSKRPFHFPMSEDLTDCEVYLATFPSLNPLSSHAILCLNVPIAKFISWPAEELSGALQDFNVRAESLNLLTGQVLYGKLKTSAEQGISSGCSSPAASEIVAQEVERHIQDEFTFFPPASEVTGFELDEEPDGAPPIEGYCHPYPPSSPDPSVPYNSIEQVTPTSNGVCWPNDDDGPVTVAHHVTNRSQEPDCLNRHYDCYDPDDENGILQQWLQRRKSGDKEVYDSTEQVTRTSNGLCWPNDDDEPTTVAHHATDRLQQPDCPKENYGCYDPDDVNGILQQWLQRRKSVDKGVSHSGTESDLIHGDPLNVPNNESYHERPCVNRLVPSPSVEGTTSNAVYLTYRHEADSELRWAPLPKASGKRPISALEQHRDQRGVSPALQSQKKKSKSAVPSNRSRENGPSSQLYHSLEISRQSCYKFNAPFGRTS